MKKRIARVTVEKNGFFGISHSTGTSACVHPQKGKVFFTSFTGAALSLSAWLSSVLKDSMLIIERAVKNLRHRVVPCLLEAFLVKLDDVGGVCP